MRLADRHSCHDLGTNGAGIDFEAPANFADAFGHAGQANSAAGTVFPKALHNRRRHSAAVVSHSQDHLVACCLQTDVGSFRSGMTVHIGQAFLQHPKQDQFGRFRKPARSIVNVQVDIDAAALSESLYEPAGSRVQARLVEKRRVQQMRNRPRFRDGIIQQLDAVLQSRIVRATSPAATKLPSSSRPVAVRRNRAVRARTFAVLHPAASTTLRLAYVVQVRLGSARPPDPSAACGAK